MGRLRRAAALATLGLLALAPAAQSAEDSASVRIESGLVAGVVSDGVARYKGIPYAAPPVGERRWRAPAPPTAWSGVRTFDDYGSSCPQAGPPRRVPAGSRAESTSEDCLTLNIWTPVERATRLPVMVWLHGGGNVNGTGSQTFYDGSAFARDGVVLVTLNYRLGILGFFAHPALGGKQGDCRTGNFGLLDQIAALRWVQRNIAAFGGDPSNVTLFGESAGAEDALILASSDAAKGLFGKVISESAGGLWARWPTLAQAQTQGAKVATALGSPGAGATAAQLRSLPIDRLAAVSDDDQIGPMLDGCVVQAPPAVALAHGARVPLIIGTNRDEDVAYFTAPARWVAARTATAGTRAYLYRFDYVWSLLASRRPSATHGSEIPFVYDYYDADLFDDTDRKIAAALHGCWIAFAQTGTPACPGVAAWPAYDPHDRRVMVFDAHPSVRAPADSDAQDLLEPPMSP